MCDFSLHARPLKPLIDFDLTNRSFTSLPQ